MATCSQCGNSEAKIGLLCPACVAANRDRKLQAQTYYATSVANDSRPSINSISPKAVAYIVLSIFLAFSVLRAAGLFGYGTLPMLKSQSGYFTQDACAGKRSCFVVVLAPWCPACKASIPFIRSLAHYVSAKADLGVQVFVSLDEESKLNEMASQVNLNALVDSHNTIYRALGGGGVPCWGVIDSEREITNHGGGLDVRLSEAHPQFLPYLQKHLKFF